MMKNGELVQPDLSQSPVVAAKNTVDIMIIIVVGGLLLVDVSNLGARNNLQLSSTHPDSQRQFYVLTSPDVHPCVIPTNLFKPVSINSEQSTSNGWSLD